jgi:hypothetical protein
MYTLRIWFESERWAIAREELEPARQAELAKRPAWQHDIVNQCFDAGVARVAHNIHPLCLLGLRKRI